MGLRLYQAPVESDIQSKPAADKGAAQARSSIRRTAFRRGPEQARSERRRRIIANAASYGRVPSRTASPPAPNVDPELLEPPVSGPATRDVGSLGHGREPGRRALHDMANRMGILDDRVVAMLGERWAQFHTGVNPSPSPEADAPADDSPQMPSVPLPPPPPEPYTVSSLRSTQHLDSPGESSSQRGTSPGLPSWAELSETQRSMRYQSDRNRWDRRRSGLVQLARTRARMERLNREVDALRQRRAMALDEGLARLSGLRQDLSGLTDRDEGVRFDGLGDRNRSLSPEGDHVWDTLLSTLTPDPQPPSVGSSFASTSASAVASQTGPAGSSRTSLDGPEVTDEPGLEPPCESGCEGTDTEGDEEDEDQATLATFTLTRSRPRLSGSRRSYAEVVRTSSDDDSVTLGGMQRIMRSLARREDIPDEWWAEAGLSRTFSRETST